uniref:nuclear transport factor 2 family protein n=1 Tax=uncultured Dysgonomonas sp. TaxID=206096 RepID=UPI00262A69D8|nr:nuclear transport factor 2 family protein [uncultured Dysgonomonas sp.]
MNTIEKNSIEELENQLLDAMLNANVETLNRLIHPDLLFNSAMGQTITKEMDLESYRSGLMIVNSITASDQQINIIEDTAVVAVTIDINAKYGVQDISGKIRFLRVWKKIESRYQIIAGSSVML